MKIPYKLQNTSHASKQLCPHCPTLLDLNCCKHVHHITVKAPSKVFFFLLPHMEVPRLEVELEPQLLAYTTAHSNAGSLIHWARAGIEPETSWILVRFVTTEPQREHLPSKLLSLCVPPGLAQGQSLIVEFLPPDLIQEQWVCSQFSSAVPNSALMMTLLGHNNLSIK